MTHKTTPDLAAGIAWLRELAGTCKAEAQQWFDRSCEDEGQEWRVRGESYAFIADQIERGHSPFAALTNPTDCCAKTREACAKVAEDYASTAKNVEALIGPHIAQAATAIATAIRKGTTP